MWECISKISQWDIQWEPHTHTCIYIQLDQCAFIGLYMYNFDIQLLVIVLNIVYIYHFDIYIGKFWNFSYVQLIHWTMSM